MRVNGFEPVEFVRRHYLEWFPAMAADADLQLVRQQGRPQSAIAVVAIADGRTWQRVIVKQNRLTSPPPRPRLGLTERFTEKHHYEARALRAIDSMLPAACPLNRAHVLEVTDDLLVLTEVPGRALDGLLHRAPMRSAPAVEAAGSWLRLFHRCRPEGMSAVPVRGDAGAVARAFEDYLGFLAEPLERTGLRPRVVRASQLLSEHLAGAGVALGLGHGDFAPRNILVDAAGHVGVIDPLGVTLCPVHEDLAYFALSLERGPLAFQRRSSGRRLAVELERRLLRGYRLADSSLVVYEGFAALVALDMWAADLVRSETAASGLSRLLRPGVGPALRLCVRSPAALLDDRLARLARLVAAR